MSTSKTVFAGLFVAVGVLLPIAFHMIGVSGRIFLPMHIPVFMAGLLLGPMYGLIVGIVVPVVSGLTTGMPPIFPTMPMMAAELAVYGAVAGFINKNLEKGVLIALLGAMVCGRIICIIALMIFGEMLQINTDPFTYVFAGVSGGLPGIILQIVFIPFIVNRLKQAFFYHKFFNEEVQDG